MARQFVLGEDWKQIDAWQMKRGQQAPKKRCFPKTGFIVDELAAGFLISCDNGVGILDFYFSNPLADPGKRSSAIDEVTNALLETAKKMGLWAVRCDTQLNAIRQKAKQFSFYKMGDNFSVYFKEL